MNSSRALVKDVKRVVIEVHLFIFYKRFFFQYFIFLSYVTKKFPFVKEEIYLFVFLLDLFNTSSMHKGWKRYRYWTWRINGRWKNKIHMWAGYSIEWWGRPLRWSSEWNRFRDHPYLHGVIVRKPQCLGFVHFPPQCLETAASTPMFDKEWRLYPDASTTQSWQRRGCHSSSWPDAEATSLPCQHKAK